MFTVRSLAIATSFTLGSLTSGLFLEPNAQAAWRGWKKFWPSIDPTNRKTWEDLGDSIADVCHWGPGQRWFPNHDFEVVVGWRADQMPFVWQNLKRAWDNPQDFSGMMTSRGDVYVVAHDYIPHVAKVESHSQICIELKDGVDKMQPHKDTMLMTIHQTVMQMEEEGCQNIPDWAKAASNEGKGVLDCFANTDWSKIDWTGSNWFR